MAPLRKKYTKQERLEIVQLSLAPQSSLREIAAQFGINPNSLYRRAGYSGTVITIHCPLCTTHYALPTSH